eukprot:COSAG06_NODE_14369_length_1162_cov_1.572907_2_plen_168_part_00
MQGGSCTARNAMRNIRLPSPSTHGTSIFAATVCRRSRFTPVFCRLNATRGSPLDRSAPLGRSSAAPASELSTSWSGSKPSKAPHVPTRAAQPWSRGALHARLCGHTSPACGADEPACFAPDHELNSLDPKVAAEAAAARGRVDHRFAAWRPCLAAAAVSCVWLSTSR